MAGEAGRAGLLINKARALELSGDDAEALTALREAAPRVSRQEDPRQYFALHFKLATTLCHLGRHAEVEPALAEIRGLAAQLGKRLDQVRVRWLEGRVAAGLAGRRKPSPPWRRCARPWPRAASAIPAHNVRSEPWRASTSRMRPAGRSCSSSQRPAWILSKTCLAPQRAGEPIRASRIGSQGASSRSSQRMRNRPSLPR